MDSPEPGDEEGESGPKTKEPLSKSHIFDLLSADRRQAVLRYLDQNDGTGKLGEIAEFIASEECDCPVEQLNSQQRKRVYVGLYQCHLPKMDDSGVVEYDKHRGTIELQDSVTQLLPYMESTDEDAENDEDADGIDAEYITLGVAICASILVSAGAFGIGVLSVVSPTGWALFAAAALVGMALLQLHR